MKTFVLSIFLLYTSTISDTRLKGSWSKGIAVVQYNAEFNRSNSVPNLSRVSDARIFNAWIDQKPELKELGRIKSVPTLVLYKDGVEVRRWEAGISMKLDISYREVQPYVDEFTGANKF